MTLADAGVQEIFEYETPERAKGEEAHRKQATWSVNQHFQKQHW